MEFCIVIVTYNRLSLLKECVACAKDQIGISNKKILIYNNASTDGTDEYLNSISDPEISFINGNENLGGAGGFYEAMKYAYSNFKFDWLTIIDDDAMLSNNYLSEIEKYAKQDKSILAYSGTVYVNGDICYYHRRHMKALKEVFSYPSEYKQPYFEYDLSTFCGLTINKRIIDKTGLHDKDLFIFFDDTDYSFKIRKTSKIININEIAVNHKTKILGKINKLSWRNYYQLRNGIIVFARNGYFIFSLRLIYRAIRNLIGMNKHEESSMQRQYNRHCVKDSISDGLRGIEGRNIKYLP